MRPWGTAFMLKGEDTYVIFVYLQVLRERGDNICCMNVRKPLVIQQTRITHFKRIIGWLVNRVTRLKINGLVLV